MIRLHRLDELFRRRVHFFRFDEGFRRTTPAGYQSRSARSLAEVGDVILDLQRQLVLVLAFLNVGAVDQLHEIVVERGLHWLDGGKEGLHLFQVLGIQDACIRRGLVSVVLENVPAAKRKVRQFGKRNKFLDERRTSVRALAQANGAHLRERSHGLRFASADELDSCHEGRADSAQARKQYSEFSFGGRDFGRLFHAAPFIERSPRDRRKKRIRTRIAAAEACCVPKQTSNDEGRPRDLQIGAGKIITLLPLKRRHAGKKSIPLL